jgi:hypothetical protein
MEKSFFWFVIVGIIYLFIMCAIEQYYDHKEKTKKPKEEIKIRHLGGISGEETSLARYKKKIVKIAIEKSFIGNDIEYLKIYRYNTGYIGSIPPQMNVGIDDKVGIVMEWLTREEFEKQYQILYTET